MRLDSNAEYKAPLSRRTPRRFARIFEGIGLVDSRLAFDEDEIFYARVNKDYMDRL
jgi:hypothetical protein